MGPVRFSLRATVRIEPCEIGPKARDSGLIFHTRESHFVAGNFRFRVLHEGGEACLIPGEARVFQRGRILVSRDCSGFAASHPVELRAQLVLGPRPDGVTSLAFPKHGFVCGTVLRWRSVRFCEERGRKNDVESCTFHASSPLLKSLRPADSTCQTKVTPLTPKGVVRMRLPVAETIALPRAEHIGIVPTSPKLPGSSPTEMISTVMSGA